ncbi:bacterial ammonia monooxygenase, subunit AmoC [Candidatus Methylocalor cossyra]|uniref:Methane/ammonia monooxygenase subunit C n=1 Tax=Candidatus Methylocalor cossyra TaxID=3108543 RepID=A0ABP1C7B9_9GAMM
MATVTQPYSGSATQEKPLVNVRNLILALSLYVVFYAWIRWYEGVYGWSAGLDAFAPEFETYWMNFLYTQIVVEIIVASILWGYLWKTRDRNLAAITPREELRRSMTHLIWLTAYATALYFGASFFTEQDATWHQTVVRDTDFTPSHIIEFYLSYPIYIITGFGAFLYAKTRLPYFSQGLSLPYLITVVGPFMILPNVGLNEWGHTFWFMEELFVAPLHYGFVVFGWFALGILGTLIQIFMSFSKLMGKELGEAMDGGQLKI